MKWLWIVVACATLPRPALANLTCVPFAPPSFSDPVFVSCPAGDVPFHVYVSCILPGRPIPGATVQIDLPLRCPAFRLIGYAPPNFPLPPGDYVVGIAGLDGNVYILAKAGGTCEPGPFSIWADGVPFPAVWAAALDQDGDLIVTQADLALARARLGSTERAADFDGDGIVTEADLALQRSHLGHAPQQPTALRPSTWGTVKVLYR